MPDDLDCLLPWIIVKLEGDLAALENVPGSEAQDRKQVTVLANAGEVDTGWISHLDVFQVDAVVEFPVEDLRVVFAKCVLYLAEV